MRLPDGSVTSSSQDETEATVEGRRANGPMVGLILNVYPSDNEDNLSVGVTADDRGWRHECKVLVTDTGDAEPFTIMDNVVIPPSSHSGLDNFAEDLPRGLAKNLVDGAEVPEYFAGIDYNDLDAEWCVVNFIGNDLDKPYISDWWYHPRNNYDPATSGKAEAKPTLTQVDTTKNLYRKFRRLNGTVFTISQKGDVYVNTNEANSTIEIEPKPKRKEFDPGGSIQVDIKKTQQLEFNWNKPVEGMSANSDDDTQKRDPSLHHKKHVKDDEAPAEREKTRTYIRGKEYDVLVHTSKLAIVAEAGGEYDGEVDLLVDKLIKMKSKDNMVLEAQTIHVGSDSSSEPLVCGDLWVTLMGKLLTAIENITVATAVGPSVLPLINLAEFEAIRTEITAKTQLSDFVTTQKAKPT